MATPHDDDAPPPIFDTADGERETPLSGPIVMAPEIAPDTVTTADLDLVDKLDREATPGEWIAEPSDRPRSQCRLVTSKASHVIGGIVGSLNTAADSELAAAARTLLPRLARALRAAIGDPESYAYQQGIARGRREAIEEAARELRSRRDAHAGVASWQAYDDAADIIEQNERARGSK